jgi:hypothetical protein
MFIVCSVQFTQIIKKAFETMLDGSERAMIKILKDEVHLQSVDSLSVCVCIFKFFSNRFFKYNNDEDVIVKFNLRPVFNFLKKQANGALIIQKKNKNVYFSLVPRYTKMQFNTIDTNSLRLVDTSDPTFYYNIEYETFKNWPCVTINPEEFTNIILDLAVGGGYTDIILDQKNLIMKTEFETGSISIQANNGVSKHFNVVDPPSKKIHNRYLTKFFKQTCTIAPSCIDMRIFIHENGPVIMDFTLENNISRLIISIAPVANIECSVD